LSANGTTFDEGNNFRIEDKLHHRMDTDLAVTNGLVTWVAGNLYVTAPGVGSTDSNIQRGIDSASSGNTVNLEAGTYDQTAVANKSITLLGAPAHASIIAPTSGSQQTVLVVNATNVTINGVAVQVNQNDDAGIGGTAPIAPVGIGGVNTDFDGLTITNTQITSIGDNTFANWTGSPSLSVRGAGIVLYDNPAGGIPSITLTNNNVDITSGTSFFQRAVWLAQLNADVTGNTFRGFANDLIFQFPSGGASLISGNTSPSTLRWLPTNAPNRLRGMNMSTTAAGVTGGRSALFSTWPAACPLYCSIRRADVASR
jgi:hypothetical protein